MMDELRKSADQVDGWCLILEMLIDPRLCHCEDLAHYLNLNSKSDIPSQVRDSKKILEVMWETYQEVYNGTHFRRIEKDAALAD